MYSVCSVVGILAGNWGQSLGFVKRFSAVQHDRFCAWLIATARGLRLGGSLGWIIGEPSRQLGRVG